MNGVKQKITASDICTIRIMFPVTTDEDALAYKKKIAEALSDKPEAQMQFMIMGNFANVPQVR